MWDARNGDKDQILSVIIKHSVMLSLSLATSFSPKLPWLQGTNQLDHSEPGPLNGDKTKICPVSPKNKLIPQPGGTQIVDINMRAGKN